MEAVTRPDHGVYGSGKRRVTLGSACNTRDLCVAGRVAVCDQTFPGLGMGTSRTGQDLGRRLFLGLSPWDGTSRTVASSGSRHRHGLGESVPRWL